MISKYEQLLVCFKVIILLLVILDHELWFIPYYVLEMGKKALAIYFDVFLDGYGENTEIKLYAS